MNLLTQKVNSGIRGPFELNQLDLSDPVERVLYENRRLEEIVAAQPQKPVKLRKRASVVTTEEKRFLCGQ